jgi:hypothetical protein
MEHRGWLGYGKDWRFQAGARKPRVLGAVGGVGFSLALAALSCSLSGPWAMAAPSCAAVGMGSEEAYAGVGGLCL